MSDQAKATFIKCFQALSGRAGPENVNAAESKMREMSTKQGFSMMLASILADKRIEFQDRQMSGLLLKNYINEHWHPSKKNFKQPEISEEEKKQLRNGVPSLLNDENSRLRTVASMIIAAIGEVDYPEKWPQLLPALIDCLSDHRKPNLVQGSLRTLLLLIEDITDEQLVQCMQRLLPSLLGILKSETPYPSEVRASSIRVYRTALVSLAELRPNQEMLRRNVEPTFKAWLEGLHGALKVNPASLQGDIDSITKRFLMPLEAARTLRPLRIFYDEGFRHYRAQFLTTLTQGTGGLSQFYQKTFLEGYVTDSDFDDDGNRIGVDVFITHALDFIQSSLNTNFEKKEGIASLSHNEKGAALTHLTRIGLKYLKITNKEEQEWLEDSDEFVLYVDNIENIFTPRAASVSIIETISNCGDIGLKAVLMAVSEEIKVAEKERTNGSRSWWKGLEACIFAVGLISGNIEEAMMRLDEDPNESKSGMYAKGTCQRLLGQVILPFLAKPDTRLPFLHATALWCVAQSGCLILADEGFTAAGFRSIMNSLSPQYSLCVRWYAARSLGLFCCSGNAEDPRLRSLISQCLPLACDLLQATKGHMLGLTLDTFTMCLGVDDDVSAKIFPKLTPILLNIWEQNTGIVLITEAVNDILGQMASVKGMAPTVLSKCVPPMIGIISRASMGARIEPGVVERAIDLISAMVRDWKGEELPPAFFSVIEPLLKLLLLTNDKSALQSGTQLLLLFLKKAKTQMLAGKVSGHSVIAVIDKVIDRLLGNNVPELGACYTGSLCHEMIFKMHKEIGTQAANGIVRKVILRIANATCAPFVEDLGYVLARLVHVQGSQYFINTLCGIRMEQKGTSAFPLVMKVWTEKYPDFYSGFHKKISILAMSSLVTSGLKDLPHSLCADIHLYAPSPCAC